MGVQADTGYNTFYQGAVSASVPFESYGIQLYATGNLYLSFEFFSSYEYTISANTTLLDFTPL
jgi:hypothetical protein